MVDSCTTCLYLKNFNITQFGPGGVPITGPANVCAFNAPKADSTQNLAGWKVITDPDNMWCGDGVDVKTLVSFSAGMSFTSAAPSPANCATCYAYRTFNISGRDTSGAPTTFPANVCARHAPETDGNQANVGWKVIQDAQNWWCGEGANNASQISFSAGAIQGVLKPSSGGASQTGTPDNTPWTFYTPSIYAWDGSVQTDMNNLPYRMFASAKYKRLPGKTVVFGWRVIATNVLAVIGALRLSIPLPSDVGVAPYRGTGRSFAQFGSGLMTLNSAAIEYSDVLDIIKSGNFPSTTFPAVNGDQLVGTIVYETTAT